MTELAFAVAHNPISDTKTLNIGLVTPLDSPFNLFLNLKQLINPDKRYVYLYIYSMGKRKIILWGVYDKYTKEFIIDSGCKYSTNQLYSMTMEWKNSGYTYIGNSVTNRPYTFINKYLDRPVMTYEEYTKKKFILKYIDETITEEDLIDKYGEEMENMLDMLETMDGVEQLNYISELEEEIKSYEKYINRTDIMKDIRRSVPNAIYDILVILTERFQQTVETGVFNTNEYEETLDRCEYLHQCKGDQCAVYFYGNSDMGYLYEGDPDIFL